MKSRYHSAGRTGEIIAKQEEIEQLKVEQDMVILAHYYVGPQVQEAMGYIGDSFHLSKVAAGLDRRTMVLCGISFTGKSGRLLSPDKVVLIPDAQADCPITHMVTKEEAEQYRREYPDPVVVYYISPTAEIKSWSDVRVASADVVRIVGNLPNRDILFIPDKNLGRYAASQVSGKYMIPINSYCLVHDQMPSKEISALKRIHPSAQVLTHPECGAQVLGLADYISLATGIPKLAAGSTSQEFVICTENDVYHELEWQSPGKYFHFPNTEPIYWDMKRTTLDRTTHALRTGQNQAPVPKAYVPPTGKALEQMFSLAWQPPEGRFQAIGFRRSIS